MQIDRNFSKMIITIFTISSNVIIQDCMNMLVLGKLHILSFMKYKSKEFIKRWFLKMNWTPFWFVFDILQLRAFQHLHVSRWNFRKNVIWSEILSIQSGTSVYYLFTNGAVLESLIYIWQQWLHEPNVAVTWSKQEGK